MGNIYRGREIFAARDKAMSGGQALYVHEAMPMPNAPACFKRSKSWGKLFDQDPERLRKSARDFGVRVIVIHHAETPRQHVDLCGRPLERAIAAMDREDGA